jgi:hypothetical protein
MPVQCLCFANPCSGGTIQHFIVSNASSRIFGVVFLLPKSKVVDVERCSCPGVIQKEAAPWLFVGISNPLSP